MVEKNLLEILACPLCKGDLIYDSKHQELICRFDRLAFPIINRVPVLFYSRARQLDLE